MSCLICHKKKLKNYVEYNILVCTECGAVQPKRIMTKLKEINDPIVMDDLALLLVEYPRIKMYDKEIRILINSMDRILVGIGHTSAEKAVAAIYITLSQKNRPCNIYSLSRYIGVDRQKVLKLAKKASRFLEMNTIFAISDIGEMIGKEIPEEWAEEIKRKCMIVSMEETLTKGLFAAVYYSNTNWTQRQVCDKFGVSIPRLQRHIRHWREYYE